MYPTHGVYQQASPYGSYPSPQHASTGPPQDAEKPSGTWWFVPSPPPQQQAQQPQPPSPYESQQQNTSPAPYFYGNPVPPAQHPDSSPTPLQQQYLGSPTYPRASTPSSSASSPPPALPRPLVRRPYHPNPPAHRSEWVMWAGNVPSDAGHDELWRFFTATASSTTSSSAASDTASTSASSERDPAQSVGTGVSGVLSIFLISRSSCAFINYDTESALEVAIARFNGLPLRPADPRCARLVCRVRRRDDDLRAGVGGQRGMGLHTKYVRDKAAAATAATASRGKQRASEAATDDESSESAASQLSALSLYSGDEEPTRPPLRPHTHGSASSGGGSHASGASTNSSLLVRHFPQRYFILKSLTRDDLDLSVRTGVWATQRHNEGVLDQAFRTAKDVFLIFSVNKSGEFYGYARMSRPVGQAETGSTGSRVTWAARSPPLSSPGSSPNAGRERAPPAATASHPVPHGDSSSVHQIPQPILSAGAHLVDDSPAPLSATSPAVLGSNVRHVNTAPAVLGRPLRAFSDVDAGPSYSLDGYARRPLPEPQIELDETAPFRAMRNVPEGTEELGRVPEEGQAQEEGGAAEGWGQNFALQWLCTERLPFTRTRQIRNPWNHDREVKVSRDGTELEPGVGQALLEEWRAYLREQQGEAAATTTTTTRS
ncbi:YT521-B-like domain-containing protein [Roridomyces roridus]|uniref:YT521-B-like domain-containing protein n=1 Tax=Roridomyces roridus TaxID=1738132 RepID=A0AAD7FYG2_9AGAR|nr:YT521-B-like domain-containing protein [Roridomyces roridus]